MKKNMPVKGAESCPSKMDHQLKEWGFGNQYLPRIWKRELNIWGRLIIFALFMGASFYAGSSFQNARTKNQSDDLVKLEENQKQIALAIKNLKLSVDRDRYAVKQSDLGRRLLEDLDHRDSFAKGVIERQKDEISNLKRKLSLFIEEEAFRKPASLRKIQVSYSQVNMRILEHEQKLEISELKEKHKHQREAFLLSHDLDRPSDNKLWKDLKKYQKIKEIAAKENFFQARSDFRKKGYRFALAP